MKTRWRSCINNGDGKMKNGKIHKPVPNNLSEVNLAKLSRLDTPTTSELDRKMRFKRSRKNKNKKLLIAKRTKFDVEGTGSLELETHKDKVLSDDYCDQKATVTEKFDLLSHFLELQIIHDVIRYVSPVWFNIVHDPHFVTTDLLKSTTVLFVHNKDSTEFAHSAEVRETDIKITKIGYPFRGPHVRLPSLQSFDEYRLPSRHCALVYAASTRDYKVVHAYQVGYKLHRCLILTLGIDNAWREIEKKEYFEMEGPISVGKFVYWNSFGDDPIILVLDVETEGFHEIYPPKIRCGGIFKYIPMGSSLSLMVSRPGFSVEAWVLRKPKTGKWAKLPDIDIEGQRHIYERIVFPREYWDLAPVDRQKNKYPVIYAFAWMKDGKVLIFRVAGSTRTYIVHNLKTGQVYPFTLDEYVPRSVDYSHPYIHSLVLFRSKSVSPLSFPPWCTICKSALSSPPPPPP
ncbi:hypothetical protein LguiA_002896 [Lonicera macranthoides]